MNIIVNKANLLAGGLTVPGSKSQSIRALLLATSAAGTSKLSNVLDADDITVALAICKALGAKISTIKQTGESGGLDVDVKSFGAPLTTKINIFTGDSGITTRFVLPMLGLRKNFDEEVTLNCSEQMRSRPIAPLLTSLRDLGMKIEETPNTVYPLTISGSLSGGATSVDGTTSQYLSALLLALPLVLNDSIITVDNLNERPYVQMTTGWLDEQNIKYSWRQNGARDIIKIPGRQTYRSFNKIIPGDFSSASYLIAAGVLAGKEVRLAGLDFDDPQGDKRLVEILKGMGADIVQNNDELIVNGENKLVGQVIDCNDIPDMVPTLAVVATQAQGTTELVNVPQARLKETDRLHSMSEGLKAMGARIEEKPDGLIIYQSSLIGAKVKGYNDHRTTMALTLAGLIAEGETIIDTAEAINKTFPNFIQILNKLGAKIQSV